MNETMIKEVSIAIGSSMYGRFEDLPNTTSHVLAEFIDNALQSSRDKRDELIAIDPSYKLNISIDIEWDDLDNGRAKVITIKDNAGGIEQSKYVDAFQPAKTPDDNTGLNEFGMGLKTAALWLGHSWKVKTKALNENIERSITFDLKNVTSEELAGLPVTSIEKDINEHYTIVSIWNSTKNVPTRRSLPKIKDEISSIYRQPLRNKEIEIFVCGECLTFTEYDILFAPFCPKSIPQGEAKLWKQDIDFKFGKYRAKGFVGILRDINKDHNGFVLMRRGRVIMGAETGGRYFPPFSGSSGTFRYKRLFGELELEGFDVSFNKNDIHDKENLEALMEIVKGKIHTKELDLFTQAEDYRQNDTIKKVKSLVKKHNSAPKVKRTTIEVVESSPAESANIHDNTSEELTIENPRLGIIEQYNDKYNIYGSQYTLDVIFASNGSELFWLDSTRENDNIITCIINASHPYFQHFEPSPSIVAVIKSMAVAKFSARKYGNNSIASMMDFFNDFIKQTRV